MQNLLTHRNTHKIPFPFPRALLAALLLTLPQLIHAQTAQQPCFNQAGIQDPSFIPCLPSSSSNLLEGGACCKAGDICWSNGLCRAATDTATNKYYYDGCTDPTWAAAGCVSQCLNVTTGNGVQVCPGSSTSGGISEGGEGVGSFCCLGFQSSCDCTDDQNVVRLDVGTVVTTLPLSSTGAAESSGSGSAPASESATDTSGTAATPAETTSNTATDLPAPSSSSTSPSNEIDNASSSSTPALSTPAQIGIGIAAASAAAVALVSLVLFILRRRRQQRAALAGHHGDAAGGAAGPAELDHSGGMRWPSEMDGGTGKGTSYVNGVKSGERYGYVTELSGNGVRWMNEKRPVEAPSA